MRQILQQIDSGRTTVREVPVPLCGRREVLIANHASLLSAGTEKMVVDLARKSLIGKARERPPVACVEAIEQRIGVEVDTESAVCLSASQRRLALPARLGQGSADHGQRRGEADECENQQHESITP